MKHSKCIVKEVSLIRTKIEVSAQVNTKAKGSKKTKETFISVGGGEGTESIKWSPAVTMKKKRTSRIERICSERHLRNKHRLNVTASQKRRASQ